MMQYFILGIYIIPTTHTHIHTYKYTMLIIHVILIIIGVVFGISAIARGYLMCCRPKEFVPRH